MFSDVKINEGLTFEKFGYKSTDLLDGSHNSIVVECVICGTVSVREYRNRYRKHSCSVLKGHEKRCYSCKEWKDLSLFNKSGRPCVGGGVAKLCRKCYNNHGAVIKCEINRKERLKNAFDTDKDLYFKKRAYQIRHQCKHNKIAYDIDFDYIYDLWIQQNGRCYYSNLEMLSIGKDNGFQGWFSPSLDRKVPCLGYTKGNVVWCCSAVNSFKQTLTDVEFKKLLSSITWNI